MKKLLFVMLVIALAAPAFAGDANVLPGGVGRFYFVPVYGFEDGRWVGGDYQSKEDNDFTIEELFNLGGAVEYGITDQISMGLQWAPGINLKAPLNSEDRTEEVADGLGGLAALYEDEPLVIGADGTFESPATKEDVTAEGISPLAIGAEVQIVGPQGYVKADPEVVRVSVTPGMEVPFLKPDWKEQGKAYSDGDAYVDPLVFAAGLSPRWAVGGQFDFDVVPHELFYLNLGFEYKYRFARTFDATGFYEETGVFLANPLGPDGDNVSGSDVDSVEYKAGAFNEITVDLEPDFRIPFDAPFTVNVSMPTTMTITSGYDVDAEYKFENTDYGTVEGEKDAASETNTGYLLTTGPSVNLFLNELPLPVQLVGTWNFPIIGTNAAKRHTGVLEARVYFSTN